ncbi:MAG: hypothetical protein WD004_06880 [Actinomycetota bacterium]
MGPSSIRLSVSGEGGEGIYSFVCPGCNEDVEKQADRKIVALLVSAGVSVAGGDAGSAPVLSSLPEAPPISLDDVIEFHYQLQNDDALQQFLEDG